MIPHPIVTPNISSRLGSFITHNASAALNTGHNNTLSKNEPIVINEINDIIATIIPK